MPSWVKKRSVLNGELYREYCDNTRRENRAKKNRRIPTEIVSMYLLILLVLSAVALMLAGEASMMNP